MTDEPITSLCCTSAAPEVITQATAERLAISLKAIADPTRLRLVSLIAAHEGREACVCDLTDPVGLSQPTVSHHLKILVDASILAREQRGRWAYYSLIPGALEAIARDISPTEPSSSLPSLAREPGSLQAAPLS